MEIIITLNNNKKSTSENILKHTSGQANELVHKTVDTANKVVKTVSGEGGLVGKVVDTSSDVLKNTSSFGNDVVGKTVDTTSNVLKGVSSKVLRKPKNN
ncbi:hypothetical protein [Litchfieldia alkalitelluris]|uniref:hypothetical protein n=1 Tax=Litchfieldia alkalitelluris TaxID=304268 RepID=UPI00099891CE|nr:hypothetical protein [Litchfieldia alkalitelluris]